jgi:hypothetical protein
MRRKLIFTLKVVNSLLTRNLMCHSRFSDDRPSTEASLIIPAFRLANLWRFSDLCALLQPLADKVMSDVDKIVFAREFNIWEWLPTAHVRLCQRQEPLTVEEATKLGMHSLLMISRLREEFPPLLASSQALSCAGVSGSGRYRGNFGHCTGCITQSLHSTASVTSKLEEMIKEWVQNGCVLAR